MSKEIVNKKALVEKLQNAKKEIEDQISKLSENEQGQLQGGFAKSDESINPDQDLNLWCDSSC